MADLKERIMQMADRHLDDPALFMVDVVIKGLDGGKVKVIVLVDGDEGITIDTCAGLSRALGAELEEQDVIGHAYTLEVSSPGLDHPLAMPRQYQKNVGRRVKVTLTDGSQVVGELLSATEENFDVAVETTEKKKTTITPTTLAYGEIQKTMVLVSFK